MLPLQIIVNILVLCLFEYFLIIILVLKWF